MSRRNMYIIGAVVVLVILYLYILDQNFTHKNLHVGVLFVRVIG